MGLLERFDRHNQHVAEQIRERGVDVEPGVQTIFSGSALLKIAAITVIVVVSLIAQRAIWAYVAAGLALLAGGAICRVLVRDVRTDLNERRSRRARR